MYTSMNIAVARARTQSDATFCITVLMSDITAVHAAPPSVIARHNRTIDLDVAVAHRYAANIVDPIASMAPFMAAAQRVRISRVVAGNRTRKGRRCYCEQFDRILNIDGRWQIDSRYAHNNTRHLEI